MLFSLSTEEGAQILRIEGELHALSAVDLRPIIQRIGEERPSLLLVDLSKLRLIDASGVGALVDLYMTVRANQGKMAVVNIRDQPLAILRVLGLDRVLMRDVA